MMKDQLPGDRIIDFYLPGTTETEREQARRELKDLAASIFDVFDRLAGDGQTAIPTSDSHESQNQHRIPPIPPNLP